MRADPLHWSGSGRRHGCWESLISHLFCFNPAASGPVKPSDDFKWVVPEWMVSLSDSRCTLGKDRSIWTTHNPLGSSQCKPQNRLEWNRNRTQSVTFYRFSFFFFLWSFSVCYLLILVHPGRIWDFTQGWCNDFLKLAAISRAGIHGDSGKLNDKKLHSVERTNTDARIPALWMSVETFNRDAH